MKKHIFLALATLTSSSVFSQETSSIKVSAYLETYFTYDFNRPVDNNRPGFVYSHNRHNEVNLNLGFVKGAFDNGNVRANLALMAGTYANANLAAEPGVLKNVFEANAGIKLSQKANLWLDVGIFASHIGFESAISKDCWVLTRNISSDNTPYYESGAKLGYITNDGRFGATLLFLNGWQRINRQNGNNQPAGGLQLTWKPSENLILNYSNYLGTEGADEVRVRRFYHNLYAIMQLNTELGIIFGMDYGTQQDFKGSSETNDVWSPVAIVRYKPAAKWALAGRFEYYEDTNGIIIPTNTPEGFKTSGYSLNLDYSPLSNAMLRLEGKVLASDDAIFIRDARSVNYGSTLTASIAVSF